MCKIPRIFFNKSSFFHFVISKFVQHCVQKRHCNFIILLVRVLASTLRKIQLIHFTFYQTTDSYLEVSRAKLESTFSPKKWQQMPLELFPFSCPNNELYLPQVYPSSLLQPHPKERLFLTVD